MNERDCTTKLMSELRVLGYEVLKHCDRFTAGIPDLSGTHREDGHTTWVEMKYLRRGKTLFDELKAIQLVTLQRLGKHAWVVVITGNGREASIYDPHEINLGARWAFPKAVWGTPWAEGVACFLDGACRDLSPLHRKARSAPGEQGPVRP